MTWKFFINAGNDPVFLCLPEDEADIGFLKRLLYLNHADHDLKLGESVQFNPENLIAQMRYVGVRKAGEFPPETDSHQPETGAEAK